MITLTSEVKEKIVEETNKGKYDQIKNIKDNEQFLYMGKFHTLEPDKMFRNKNGELMVTVKPKPISNQSYATILEKRGNKYTKVKSQKIKSDTIDSIRWRSNKKVVVVQNGQRQIVAVSRKG